MTRVEAIPRLDAVGLGRNRPAFGSRRRHREIAAAYALFAPALLLVLTDQAPPENTVPEKGRMQWWAFGSPRPNLAFVNAARTSRGGPGLGLGGAYGEEVAE